MDEKVKLQIIMVLLGALIASSASLSNSYLLWNSQVNSEKKNIAQGFSQEIVSMEPGLTDLDNNLINSSSSNDVFIQETPIYPDTGMYFVLQKSVFLLDENTSRDLFFFYTNLISAEQNRKLVWEIQRKSDTRVLTNSEKLRQKMLTKSIKQSINNSVTVMPALEKELDAIYK
jgi:hypothetical protein